jgi:transcriptional regulator with GAF, ATPase, and Fis domain
VLASTAPGGPASTLSATRLALYVVYPREVAGQVIELARGLTIGRGPAALPGDDGGVRASGARPFAVLGHPTVSRRHCAVEAGFATPVLSDLGSSNGTRLDGVELAGPQPLVPHSVLRMGDVLGVVDEPPAGGSTATAALPGLAPAMARARAALERAAGSMAPVVVSGETGTGKERVAAELHRRSGRPGPYVKFSCAELARELVESQLFGHERGAFTGATTSHQGLFAAAHRGTLFLDEIGELALDLQAKLLRVLQEGEVRPLGSLRTERVDVRVVAATNRDLAAEVERGTFRRDLYARLSFFEVTLPPLRARKQDIFWWLERLTADFAASSGQAPLPFQLRADAAELVFLHAWPENLRGLNRFVHRVLASGETSVGQRALAELVPEVLQGRSLPNTPRSDPPEKAFDPDTLQADRAQLDPYDRPSREQFLTVYESTGRNVRATSRHFGKDRRQIYRWLELFGIQR